MRLCGFLLVSFDGHATLLQASFSSKEPLNVPNTTQLSAVTADVAAMSRDRVAVQRIAFKPCSD